MRDVRGFLSLACFVAAVFSAIMAIVVYLSGPLADHSAENGRRIDARFLDVARYLDSFIQANGRLPDSIEKAAWEQKHSGDLYPVTWDAAAGDEWAYEWCKNTRQVTSNSYVLSYWRGEWMERYASCNRRTTLLLDRNLYFQLGGPGEDSGALAIFSLLLIWLGFKVRPNTSIELTPDGAAHPRR